MVKPVVTITSFVLGGLALAFAAYVQSHPRPVSPPREANDMSSLMQQLAGRAVADEKAAAPGAKNEVFVVMIEPMFFMGVASPEATADAPFISPSRTDQGLTLDQSRNKWILSANPAKQNAEPCVR